MAKAKKEVEKTKTAPPAKKATETTEPFTDVHERCAFLDGLKKIVNIAGDVVEAIPQAWHHSKGV